jgi:hypothetical protein
MDGDLIARHRLHGEMGDVPVAGIQFDGCDGCVEIGFDVAGIVELAGIADTEAQRIVPGDAGLDGVARKGKKAIFEFVDDGLGIVIVRTDFEHLVGAIIVGHQMIEPEGPAAQGNPITRLEIDALQPHAMTAPVIC